MSQTTFQDMLYLYACGALGRPATLGHPVDLQGIYRLARQQGILGVLYLALKELRQSNKLDVDENLWAAWESAFLSGVMTQLKRRNEIHKVLAALEQAGIPAYLLKGDVVALHYREPLSRVSSDTDIYVGRENLAAAEKVFEDCGFLVKARSPMEHHTVCSHPSCGSVDLHLTFHDDCFEETYFKGYTQITEPGVHCLVDGVDVPTLGYTDNAVFLFLHMVKHFLSCGTGIRQIMDFLLFWRANREQIDIDSFKNMLDTLGFANLYGACVDIGIRYLGLSAEELSGISVEADPFFTNWLLTDIEQGGVFGRLDRRKLTMYYLFENDFQENRTGGDFFAFAGRYAKTFGYDFLARRYGYLKKNKLLLPIAWGHRAVDLLKSATRVAGTLRKVNADNDEMTTIKNRAQMIERLRR